MKPFIIFVDDEKNVLSAIKRAFFDSEEWDFHYCTTGQEALDIMKTRPASVIVSDMRMPGMDGVSFLKKSREISPDSVRMVLSAFADIETIMEAVNNGYIWRYITKPWNDSDLKIAIKNAVEYAEKKKETKDLLAELAQKNQLLEESNALLESRVRERTLEYLERNKLLHMILDSKDIGEIAQAAAESITAILKGDAAFVYVPDQISNETLSEEMRLLAEATLASGNAETTADGIAIPIIYNNEALGVILFEYTQHTSATQIAEVSESIGSVLAIALSHDRILHDVPSLMTRIDELFGEL